MLGVGLAVGLVAAGVAALAPGATAAPIGTLSFTSDVNDNVLNSQNDTFRFLTSAGCPAPATNFQIRIAGPGLTGAPNIQGNTSQGTVGGDIQGGPFSGPVQQTLAGFAATQGQPGGYLAAGDYTVELVCRTSGNSTSLGEFTAAFAITGSGASSVVTIGAPDVPDTTEVTLTTTPAGNATWGQQVTVTATVANLDDAATKPTGTVQFVNGATDLGAAVALVNGVATTTTSTLPVGISSLTAEYDPGAGLFVADTSDAVAVTVSIPKPALAKPATLGGVARVGSAIVCNPGTWLYATQYSYALLRNGVAVQTSTSDNDRVLAVSDLNYLYSCRVTATNPTGSTAYTTSAARVAAGPASVATVKPRILGTAAVGKRLTASRGSWSPAATSYVYTWKLGTKVLRSGATATTYVPPRTLRGKSITLTVVAKRVGYLDGVATSAGVRIR
jgi:hypothetical protein